MQTHNNGATMRKVLRHIRKYWFYFMLSLLFAAVTVTLTLYLPILIGEAVDLILDPGQVDFEGIGQLLFIMGVMIGGTALSQGIMNVCNNKITYHTIQDIREEAFQKIEKLPLKYIDPFLWRGR